MASNFAPIPDLERNTKQGPVLGKDLGNCFVWAGVPYAASVRTETRFKSPEDALPRHSVLDCTNYRASAVQANPDLPERLPEDDDCLFLNIWVPKQAALDATARLPVFFWIHGGSYAEASGAGYCGAEFCVDQRVIVVTINYRLGILGFVNLNAVLKDKLARFDGNVGLKDQIKALQWVHENITYFHGDANKITIAGESAGAGSVMMLMTVPKMQSYYSQAISQSEYKLEKR
eukprot:Gregarina_sp_Pseudo_9__1955@NODE_2348_length_1030_cov_201_404642_g2162_i0_p1_GENE_NODE_2348_length_1030_cov_201_404642_g2162_i0NODE_2348_length_1030_cov_201_404642_g2162_i0_p1_ORF_typecomplete_len232_score27_97COesterase/PF00135_28/3_4e69Abhydrolase_3/PF07859_13/2_1e12Peptidase_S9/PF00326_21/1_1e05Chlorophyllase2/PF12740_7/0_00029Say1_Mug180/PF10340_9/0_0053Esterase/PF00756_20/0_0073Esterase_phd/PF10503_9/0_59_NODE_2348_length_1030_cov_201_404642_g2162_i0209904